MNTLLGDLLGKDVFAYLHDLIICSKDADSHSTSLEAVLDKLRKAGTEAETLQMCFPEGKSLLLRTYGR